MKSKPLFSEFETTPAVFAVENTYRIMVPVNCNMIFWVEVGEETFYDHSNGILRSDTLIHSVTVPMETLNAAGEYTVCFKKMSERKPYHPVSEAVRKERYRFVPVRQEGKLNIYHLSDTHGSIEAAAKAGSYFGDALDLLVLNGDIPDNCADYESLLLHFRLCQAITGGEHPCVFARGNHDLRGTYAEQLERYCPVANGRSYYTFRLGRLWGLVLDCGEDKPDSHPEYGSTVCFSEFRKEESAFLKAVCEKGEYRDEGIEYKLVVVHLPFTYTMEPPFDTEQARYQEWTDMLNRFVQPDLLLGGHLHIACVAPVGGEYDTKGQPCPVVFGSQRETDGAGNTVDFIGSALTLDGKTVQVAFTDAAHTVRRSVIL